MRTRKIFVLSLVSAGAAFLFSGCPSQPPSPCVIGHAGGSGATGTGTPYVVQFYLNSDAGFAPSPGCASNPNYAYWPSGNFVGDIFVESYGPVTASQKLTGIVPEEFGWTNPYFGEYVQGSPNSTPPITNNPVSLGNFTTDTQSANGTCIIQQKSPAIQKVPANTQANGPPVDTTVTYNFPFALVYTNPAGGEGTQIQLGLQIIRDDGSGNTCIRNYIGVGLWPTIVCNVDNDCNPNPQPNNGRPLGSGLLPGIPYACVSNLVPQDPVIIPANVLADGCGCSDLPDGGSSPAPFLPQTGACCGGAKDNNNLGAPNICFFPNPAPNTFPYTN